MPECLEHTLFRASDTYTGVPKQPIESDRTVRSPSHGRWRSPARSVSPPPPQHPRCAQAKRRERSSTTWAIGRGQDLGHLQKAFALEVQPLLVRAPHQITTERRATSQARTSLLQSSGSGPALADARTCKEPRGRVPKASSRTRS